MVNEAPITGEYQPSAVDLITQAAAALKASFPQASEKDLLGTLPQVLQTLQAQGAVNRSTQQVRQQLTEGRVPVRESQNQLANFILQGVDLAQVRDPQTAQMLSGVISTLNTLSAETLGPETIREYTQAIQSVLDQAKEAGDPGTAQIQQILVNLENLNSQMQAQMRGGGVDRRDRGSVGLYLTGDEIQRIESGTEGAKGMFEEWISQIESRDHIYAEEDENQGFFQKYQFALTWFAGLPYENEPQDSLLERKNAILREYRTRKELHNMRRSLSTYNWDAVMGHALKMGSAVLYEGLHLRNSQIAFNLYQQYFERFRFRYGKTTEVFNSSENKYEPTDNQIEGVALDRIVPETVHEIRQMVSSELVKNRQLYGFASEEEAIKASIIGFNIFRASMRMGVHTARGRIKRAGMEATSTEYRKLRKEGSFVSDPEELLVNLYNPWQYAIEKWTKYGMPDYTIYNKILDSMGNGDREVGQREMVNVLAIVDFFSSGWRIGEITEALNRRITPTGTHADYQEKSMATGLRLQVVLGNKETTEVVMTKKREALKISARYRPLELAKAYAVTVDEGGLRYTTGAQQDKFQQMLANGEFRTKDGKPLTNFVKLEEVLGRYLYPIYNKMMLLDWNELRGIDIGTASQGGHADNPFAKEDYEVIREVVEAVNHSDIPADEKLDINDLQNIYRKLQSFFASAETVNDFINNPKLAYLSQKTLYLDDIALGKLEEEKIQISGNPNPLILTPISKMFHDVEGGRRDPYGRMWGDTQAAFQVHEHLAKAMTARDPNTLVKELAELSGPLMGYAGRMPFMKLSTHVATGWLELAKADGLWGAIGLADRVPWATSEFEKLFGLAAPSLTRDKLKGVYEQIKLIIGDFKQVEPGPLREEAQKLEKHIVGKLGVETWKTSLVMFKTVALLVLLAMLQEVLKEVEKEE